MKKAIINGGIGSKVICAVTDGVTLEAAPIKGTDNGDGTASLLVTSSMAELPQKVQLHANIDFSSDSAQTIIDAPVAGNRIRLTRLSLSSGSNPQVNVEIALKSGATTIETVRGDAMVFDYPEHRNLDTNEAFVVKCTTADRVIGGVDYYIEAV